MKQIGCESDEVIVLMSDEEWSALVQLGRQVSQPGEVPDLAKGLETVAAFVRFAKLWDGAKANARAQAE